MMTLEQYLAWKKLTQAQFAAQVKVNQGTISKLVSGKKPKWATAAKIERATGGAVPVAVWAPEIEQQGAA